jgi:hypothetical protein
VSTLCSFASRNVGGREGGSPADALLITGFWKRTRQLDHQVCSADQDQDMHSTDRGFGSSSYADREAGRHILGSRWSFRNTNVRERGDGSLARNPLRCVSGVVAKAIASYAVRQNHFGGREALSTLSDIAT